MRKRKKRRRKRKVNSIKATLISRVASVFDFCNKFWVVVVYNSVI